ncbi:dcl1 [Symbiodinium sp. CCMP2592]|nr:dcl1 [Symbiodinium sp. CCMP2592]
MPPITAVYWGVDGAEMGRCRFAQDSKVADAKMLLKGKGKLAKPGHEAQLLFKDVSLKDPSRPLLQIFGQHAEAMEEGGIQMDLQVQLSAQVVFKKGDGSRRCRLCDLEEEEWSQEYDKVPNYFLKCKSDCQVLVCKACWDGGIEECPNCHEAVSSLPSEVTFTEKLEDPGRLLEFTGPVQKVDLKPWRGKPDPRAYQEAAFKAAVHGNRILVLPTGTGKTLVATMLVDHFLADEPQGFAVVVVNVAPLVRQQADYIRDKSTIQAVRVTEQLGNGVEWTEEYWRAVRQNQVIVCTAEILRKAIIDHAFLRLDGCKLLVFDEAHHALGGHPFVRILERVSEQASGPRIVGLTACFLHGRLNAPEAKRQQLEDRFAGTIWVPEDADIRDHLPSFNFERLVANRSGGDLVSERIFLQKARELQQSILSGLPQDLQDMVVQHANKAEGVMKLLGRAGAEFYFSHGLLPCIQQKLEIRGKVFSKGQKSQRSSSKIQAKIAQLEDMQTACQSDLPKRLQGLQAGLDDISGKAQALVQRLQELLELDEQTRCIVFVAEVAPSYPLAELLNSRVKPGILPVSGRSSMSDTVRETNLRKFRDEKEPVWCLVATSCLEEGIDIPSCNVVVRFDKFDNVKSHVQGTGRCRGAGKGGLVIYFENDPEEEQLRAQQVHQIAQRDAQEPVAAGPRQSAAGSIHPATGAEINRGNCLTLLNSYISRACSGNMSLDDAFKPSSAAIKKCVVPTRDTDLTVSAEDVKEEVRKNPELASWMPRERFALLTLMRLREQGLLSENHIPEVMPGEQQTFDAQEVASRRRHLRFNPKALELLQAVKSEMLKRIRKGLNGGNSKGILKECVDLLRGGTDDIVYRDVPCGSGFQRRVCLKVLPDEPCFPAGESCPKKVEAEQSAARKALEELQALLEPIAERTEELSSVKEAAAKEIPKTGAPSESPRAQEAPVQVALEDAGTELSPLPVQNAAALQDAGAEMSSAPMQAAAAVEEGMSLKTFCAEHGLSDRLHTKLKGEDIRSPEELLMISEEDISKITSELKIGDKARFRKAIESLR